jgi:hypothetical protein
MDTKLCRMLRIEFPLLAFSRCRNGVASASRLGGLEVFGASGCTPEQLEGELAWIDAGVDSIPSCRQVLAAFMTGFADALEHMRLLTETGG